MIQSPLIYIDQPDIPIPDRSMQKEYHSLDSLSDVDQELTNEKQNLTSEKKEKSEENIKLKESSNDRSFKRTEQVFTQMTIDEKIDYLITPSKYLPKLKCRVLIGQKNYHGKVLKREGKRIIFLETHTLKKHNLEIEKIESIDIIGF